MWYIVAFICALTFFVNKKTLKKKKGSKYDYSQISNNYFERHLALGKNKDWEKCLENYIKAEFLFVCGASRYGFTSKEVFKESHINPSLIARFARESIINLNLDKKAFKKFISEIEMEKFNDPYPVSFKSLIPEFLKAYDEMKEDVEKTKDLLNKHKRKS